MSQRGLHLFFVTEVAGHAQGSQDVPPAYLLLALTGCVQNASGLCDRHLHFNSLQAVAAHKGTCPFPMALSLSTLAATPLATRPSSGSIAHW